MTPRSFTTLGALALILASCSDSSSGAPDSGTGDLSPAQDGALVDQAPPSDSARRDQPLANDVQGPEAAVSDSQLPDQGADGSAADLLISDAATPDLAADGPLADGPCATGATSEVLIAGQMVACLAGAAGYNQCDAASLCGAGWHLCTASEYLAHFATVAPPISESCWLAGCVRDGGTPSAPSDSVCSSCAGASGSEEEVGWGCLASITLTADELQVGLRASTSCGIVGEQASANEGYWQPWPTQNLLPGAVCCQ